MSAKRDFPTDISRPPDFPFAQPVSPAKCEKCGANLTQGMWPWCKGHPEDHSRVSYSWHFAQKD